VPLKFDIVVVLWFFWLILHQLNMFPSPSATHRTMEVPYGPGKWNGRGSKRKQEEARGSKIKQEEARGSKRKLEEARESKRKEEEARGSKTKLEEARGSKRKLEEARRS